MSDYDKALESLKNEIQIQIHFNECWDETIYLTYAECVEWVEWMQDVLNSNEFSVQKKLQKIVDSITAE